ncbi:hypothetical protein CEXT_126091 [Caerostris extrusa]|uniref:Maturase K n=1 Tax=Caerostris extrusa TaxID=172846 RepID=A0AAV4QTN3_CAEEX|nr:hypothetical protein CEXT_126091 [Caerostris extrusa]
MCVPEEHKYKKNSAFVYLNHRPSTANYSEMSILMRLDLAINATVCLRRRRTSSTKSAIWRGRWERREIFHFYQGHLQRFAVPVFNLDLDLILDRIFRVSPPNTVSKHHSFSQQLSTNFW